MLFDPFNRVMLSRYAGLASIPMCDIAFTGSLQVKTLIETGLRALMPEVSRLNGVPTDGTRQRINELYHQAMRLTLCVGVPLYAVLIAACPVLLRMWLRDGFMEGLADVFRITLAASLISLLVVPSWYILLGLGFARCTLISYAICVSVHLVCVLGFLAVFRTVKPWYVAVAYLAGIVASSTYIMDQRRHRCQESQRVVRRGVPRRANHDQRAQWL
jgi:O-antigen/teichoic acid export membrane protein